MPEGRTVLARERLASDIRAAIDAGQLKPGDRIGTSADIAASGVGRNTYREALRLLESEGLIVAMRGVKGGTFVTAPSTHHARFDLLAWLNDTLDDTDASLEVMFETRRSLEVTAASFAAARRSDEELARLASYLPSTHQLSADEAFGCSWRFHSTILDAAHNPLIKAVAERVSAAIRVHFARHPRPFHSERFIWTDHEELYAHIDRGESAQAAAVMSRHLGEVRELSADPRL